MGIFGYSFRKVKALPWPKQQSGELVLPALLKTTLYDDMDVEITINMLTAYGFPTDKKWRRKTHEVDIYVPETMLEDALSLLSAEIVDNLEAVDNEPVALTPLEVYKKWFNSPALSDSERRELEAIADNDAEIELRFFAPLSFGTAGLRGVMALGTNMMNIHVIRHATQAFSEIIIERNASQSSASPPTVAISHDCRHNSRLFAEETACVLAGNGIRVRLFEGMRPTPELSFAVRKYGCAAGINITASHNTKEYNGYKVYWSDGAQLPPAEARLVAERMAAIDVFDSIKRENYKSALENGDITLMGVETDNMFLDAVLSEVAEPDEILGVAEHLTVVYTPFHGTGSDLVPRALYMLGLRGIYNVEEQMVPDGDFPTVESPNPEHEANFDLAKQLAAQVNADIIIGTDPDTDRIAVLVRDGEGYTHISGHKTGVLLLDYVIASKKRAGKLPENAVALKTIVTTEMARRVAEYHGVTMYDTFTGFKFMAERKNELESAGTGHVIFSYEESYGYMIGDYVRDKDAVTAAVLIAEMAAWYLGRGMTLLDALDSLYEAHGYHGEETVSLVMPGIDGLRNMERLMTLLRENPPTAIEDTAVVSRRDYESGIQYDGNNETRLPLSGSNVLRFDLSDGTVILIRPSGTEPKIKVYILARGVSKQDCGEKTLRFATWANALKLLV